MGEKSKMEKEDIWESIDRLKLFLDIGIYLLFSSLSHCAAVLAFRAGKETASDGRIMFGNRNTLDSTYVCIPALGFILELDVPFPLLWPVGFVFSS